MSNYSNTKATIAANVYTNHNNEVTAAMVKTGINAVVDTLIAGGFIYKGVAHPGDPAITSDANIFVIATEAGTYTNFKNSSNVALQVADGEVCILKYNGSWSKEVTGAATAAEVSALGHKVDEVAGEYSDVRGDYIKAVVDKSNKILQAIDSNGVIRYFADISVQDLEKITTEETQDYIRVVTDNEKRIICGIKKDGKTHIGQLDAESVSKVDGDSLYYIPILDADFVSPLPFKIYGLDGNEDISKKGTDEAKYIFDLNLADEFNIRFKFRITEDLLASPGDYVIASVNGAEVYAKSISLSQCSSPVTYNGVEKTQYWPATDGGVVYNKQTLDRLLGKRNLGCQAFSIQYVGNGDDITISNDGEKITLTIDGISTDYSFNDYPTVPELYAALASNSDFRLDYGGMDKRYCSELATFTAVKLKGTFYCREDASYEQPRQEIVDAAPFYLNYSVSEKWVQVEIVKINGAIYCVCDGNVLHFSDTKDNQLILGGECRVLFKELEIRECSSYDAEIRRGFVISSANPYILIFEGHGIFDGPAYSVTAGTTEDYMSSMNPDTIDLIFGELNKKGYAPVSIRDISEFYCAGKPLPSRCYVMIFDDFRWDIFLDNRKRRVFNKYGAIPTFATITEGHSTVTHDGETISVEKASQICKTIGWDLVSHTSTHRSSYGIKPSQYLEYLTSDIYSADNHLVDGSVLVYPGGANDMYMNDVMEYLGFKLGIKIMGVNGIENNLGRNRFNLRRVNISRIKESDGTPISYEDTFLQYIV